MKYTIASAINLAILVVGISIGLLIGAREKTVSAQQSQPAACVDSVTVECVRPNLTVSSGGIGKLLANQISTDQLTVNGYDMLKLQNNLLSALVQHGVLLPAQAQEIANQAHPDRALRFQPAPIPPAPAPPSKP